LVADSRTSASASLWAAASPSLMRFSMFEIAPSEMSIE
jgi:hypothetical protein